MPSPPKVMRYGYRSSAEWYVLSQGVGSFSKLGVEVPEKLRVVHCLVSQLSKFI